MSSPPIGLHLFFLHPILATIIRAHRRIPPKDPLFQILSPEPQPPRPFAEENSLGPLPQLTAHEKGDNLHKHDPPLPADTGVLKDIVVDDGDIQRGENSAEARNDGPEEELVPPHIVRPLGEVSFGAWLRTEK